MLNNEYLPKYSNTIKSALKCKIQQIKNHFFVNGSNRKKYVHILPWGRFI